jgi:hypothetical protein
VFSKVKMTAAMGELRTWSGYVVVVAAKVTVSDLRSGSPWEARYYMVCVRMRVMVMSWSKRSKRRGRG